MDLFVVQRVSQDGEKVKLLGLWGWKGSGRSGLWAAWRWDPTTSAGRQDGTASPKGGWSWGWWAAAELIGRAEVRATEIWPPSSGQVVAKWQRPGLGNINSAALGLTDLPQYPPRVFIPSTTRICLLSPGSHLLWQTPQTPINPCFLPTLGGHSSWSLISHDQIALFHLCKYHSFFKVPPKLHLPLHSPPGNGSQSAHPSTALTTGCAHMMPAVWWQRAQDQSPASWLPMLPMTHSWIMSMDLEVAWSSHISVSHLHMGARRVPISTKLWKNYRRQRM